jgi:hypothetical protein
VNVCCCVLHKCLRFFGTGTGPREELSGVDDNWMALVAKHCPQLQELVLDLTPSVTNIGVLAIARSCSQLKVKQCFLFL